MISAARTAFRLIFFVLLVNAVPARAADLVISGATGDMISDIAQATQQLRLAAVSADLRVQCDSMSFDYTHGVLAYSGNVRVTQGNVRLSSDALMIAFEPRRSGRVRSVRASGNVTVVNKDSDTCGQDTRPSTAAQDA